MTVLMVLSAGKGEALRGLKSALNEGVEQQLAVIGRVCVYELLYL